MNGGGFILGYSLSLIGRNTYLKVDKEGKAREASPQTDEWRSIFLHCLRRSDA